LRSKQYYRVVSVLIV